MPRMRHLSRKRDNVLRMQPLSRKRCASAQMRPLSRKRCKVLRMRPLSRKRDASAQMRPLSRKRRKVLRMRSLSRKRDASVQMRPLLRKCPLGTPKTISVDEITPACSESEPCRIKCIWAFRTRNAAEIALRTNIGFVTTALHAKYCRNRIGNEHRVCNHWFTCEIPQKSHWERT